MCHSAWWCFWVNLQLIFLFEAPLAEMWRGCVTLHHSPKYRTLICCRVVGFKLHKKEKEIGGRWRGRRCGPCYAVKYTSLCNATFNIFLLLFLLYLAFDSRLAALLFCYFCCVQNKGTLIQANQAWGSLKQSTSFHVLCIKGTVLLHKDWEKENKWDTL